jgi:hypothetical protein
MGLRFDVFDPGDVEEMVLIIVCDLAFHLSGIDSAVRLSDVNDRDAKVRQDVTRHLTQREHGTQDNRNDGHQNRDGRRSALETRFIR